MYIYSVDLLSKSHCLLQQNSQDASKNRTVVTSLIIISFPRSPRDVESSVEVQALISLQLSHLSALELVNTVCCSLICPALWRWPLKSNQGSLSPPKIWNRLARASERQMKTKVANSEVPLLLSVISGISQPPVWTWKSPVKPTAPLNFLACVCVSLQDAFWGLVQICEKYLPGYYSPGLVRLPHTPETCLRIISLCY